MTEAFDPSRLLSSFLPGQAFRKLQTAMGFLIAGQLAFQFLKLGAWAKADNMEVCAYPEHAVTLAAFFISNGYSIVLGFHARNRYARGAYSSTFEFMEGDMASGSTSVGHKVSRGCWTFARTDIDGRRTRIVLIAAKSVPLLCILGLPSSGFLSCIVRN